MDAQTVRFRPLDTTQQASVLILDDVIVEGAEDFIGQIRILPGPSVEVLNGTTTIVIQDDDGVCVCVCDVFIILQLTIHHDHMTLHDIHDIT